MSSLAYLNNNNTENSQQNNYDLSSNNYKSGYIPCENDYSNSDSGYQKQSRHNQDIYQ